MVMKASRCLRDYIKKILLTLCVYIEWKKNIKIFSKVRICVYNTNLMNTLSISPSKFPDKDSIVLEGAAIDKIGR